VPKFPQKYGCRKSKVQNKNSGTRSQGVCVPEKLEYTRGALDGEAEITFL
jgi:hypothetical protein